MPHPLIKYQDHLQGLLLIRPAAAYHRKVHLGIYPYSRQGRLNLVILVPFERVLPYRHLVSLDHIQCFVGLFCEVVKQIFEIPYLFFFGGFRVVALYSSWQYPYHQSKYCQMLVQSIYSII